MAVHRALVSTKKSLQTRARAVGSNRTGKGEVKTKENSFFVSETTLLKQLIRSPARRTVSDFALSFHI